jgi:hypothetical protein
MSKQLKGIVEQFITKHGRVGKAQLCEAINRDEKTLDRWLKNGIPDRHARSVFKLALACGLNEEDALKLTETERASQAS